MKTNVLLSTIACVFCVIALYGCNADKQDEITDSKENFEPINTPETTRLVQDLQSFNDELLQGSTRGWRDWLLVCAVAGADIIGTAEGAKIGGAIGAIGGPVGAGIGGATVGLICGAGASYGAYKGCSITAPYNKYHPKYNYEDVYNEPGILYRAILEAENVGYEEIKNDAHVEVVFPAEYQYVEEVGIKHNAILENLAKNGNLSKSEMIELNKSDLNYTQDEQLTLNYLESPKFKVQYQSILDQTLVAVNEMNSLDVDLYFKNPSAVQLSPLAQEIMRLFMDVYLQYPNEVKDVDFVINYYMDRLEKSEILTAADKEALYSGFAVAAYSPRFWSANLSGESVVMSK